MSKKEKVLFSLDDVPLKDKVRDLIKFAGFDSKKVYSVKF